MALALVLTGSWFLFRGPEDTSPRTISVTLLSPTRDLGIYGNNRSTDVAQFRSSYETAVGEQFSVRLADGSVATLNTNSEIDVRYSRAERLILLRRGEVSFHVAPHSEWPFQVVAGTQRLQALGTVFNVRLGPRDNVEVTVSEGHVRVSDILAPNTAPAVLNDDISEEAVSADLTLSAGEIAIIDRGVASVRAIDSVEIDAKLSWHEGFVVTQGNPLSAVIEDVSRYTETTIIIADDSIRNLRVGGYFRAGDVEGLLLALEESFGIDAERLGDDLVVLTAR